MTDTKTILAALYVVNKHAKEIRDQRSADKEALFGDGDIPAHISSALTEAEAVAQALASYCKDHPESSDDMQTLIDPKEDGIVENSLSDWDKDTVECMLGRDLACDEYWELVTGYDEIMHDARWAFNDAQKAQSRELHNHLTTSYWDYLDSYALKDTVLDALGAKVVAHHLINGSMYDLYEIDGYRFHRPSEYTGEPDELIDEMIPSAINPELSMGITLDKAESILNDFLEAI